MHVHQRQATNAHKREIVVKNSFDDKNSNSSANDYHLEGHNVFNETDVDANHEFDIEDDDEDDDYDDVFINEELPENFRNSSKLYSIMKS
jgi:hypothetical protein